MPDLGTYTLTFIKDGPGNVFVYEGPSPARGALVASHCPVGRAVDLFGVDCPEGDWCAEGWALMNMIEVWPGTVLAKRNFKP